MFDAYPDTANIQSSIAQGAKGPAYTTALSGAATWGGFKGGTISFVEGYAVSA
jgi:hypothetical protein